MKMQWLKNEDGTRYVANMDRARNEGKIEDHYVLGSFAEEDLLALRSEIDKILGVG